MSCLLFKDFSQYFRSRIIVRGVQKVSTSYLKTNKKIKGVCSEINRNVKNNWYFDNIKFCKKVEKRHDNNLLKLQRWGQFKPPLVILGSSNIWYGTKRRKNHTKL